jgi:hypothetical protein
MVSRPFREDRGVRPVYQSLRGLEKGVMPGPLQDHAEQRKPRRQLWSSLAGGSPRAALRTSRYCTMRPTLHNLAIQRAPVRV